MQAAHSPQDKPLGMLPTATRRGLPLHAELHWHCVQARAHEAAALATVIEDERDPRDALEPTRRVEGHRRVVDPVTRVAHGQVVGQQLVWVAQLASLGPRWAFSTN